MPMRSLLALGPKQLCEVVVIPSNGGMILAESLFVDHDGPAIERLGLGILALLLKQTGEGAVIVSNGGMILAESFLVDLDDPAIERLRLFGLFLCVLCRLGRLGVLFSFVRLFTSRRPRCR